MKLWVNALLPSLHRELPASALPLRAPVLMSIAYGYQKRDKRCSPPHNSAALRDHASCSTLQAIVPPVFRTCDRAGADTEGREPRSVLQLQDDSAEACAAILPVLITRPRRDVEMVTCLQLRQQILDARLRAWVVTFQGGQHPCPTLYIWIYFRAGRVAQGKAPLFDFPFRKFLRCLVYCYFVPVSASHIIVLLLLC